MRILLAFLLSTSFVQAMDGEIEVKSRAMPTQLTAQLYKRVIEIRNQIAKEKHLDIEDLTGGKLKKSTSEENAGKVIAQLNEQYCKTSSLDNKENQQN